AAWAVAAGVACAAGLAGVLLFYRSRATSQLQTAVQTGRIDVTAFLDTASLPGTWPVDARRTMGVSRNNAPAMPIQFAVGDTFLHLWKTKLGTHPFTAEIA